MHHWENGMAGASGVVMVSRMLAFFVLTVVAIVWAVRSARYSSAIDSRAQQSGAGDVECILAGRLACGEIDPDRYRTTLTVLRSRSSS